jgi:Escherichia/Staphylococcus phage prohead protease
MSRNRGKPLAEQELRYWKTLLEASGEGTERRIGGLGVPYGKHSRLLAGGFREVVENLAIAKTLADKLNIVCRLERPV